MNDILDTRVGSSEIAIFFLGQNSFVLKSPRGTLAAIDPYFSRHPKASYVHKEPPVHPEDFQVDFVFCTHDHLDHTDPTTLSGIARGSPKTVFFGPPPSCDRMLKIGIDPSRVRKLEASSTVEVADFKVTSFSSLLGTESKPAWNPWEEKWTDHYGYVFDFGFVKVYNMGDSSPEATENPTKILNDVAKLKPDIAMFPIIGDLPRRKPEDAFTFAKIVRPKIVIPCHYDCFRNVNPTWPRTVDPKVFADMFKGIPDIKPVIIDYKGKYIYKAHG